MQALHLPQQQRRQQVVAHRVGPAFVVVDHQLWEDLGDFLCDETVFDRVVAFSSQFFLVAKGHRAEGMEATAHTIEIVDVLLEAG